MAIQDANYAPSTIHPSIYPARNQEVENCIITNNNHINQKRQNFKIPREFQHFHQLIDDSIDNMYTGKKMRKDASQYAPIIIKSPSMAVIIQKKKKRTELVQYLHVAYFSPIKSTFEKAMTNNHFKTWPRLTPGILKHLATSISTVRVHLHQERQILQSTKK